jgi:hypothetical protein
VPIRRVLLFAGTCVFTKQSLGPILCGLLRLRAARAPHLQEAPLLPKLRGHVAEFLLQDSLEHLRLLASPTCVGLRYGQSADSRTRLFSAACLEDPSRKSPSRSASGLTSSEGDLPPSPGYPVASGRPAPDGPSASASPLAVKRLHPGTGILTRFPSPTPLGLSLGTG